VAAPLPHPPKLVVFAQLDRFLHGKAPIHIRQVPWPVDRNHILEYLRERLENGAMSTLAASRIPVLAEAYLLSELPALVLPMLQAPVTADTDPRTLASLCAAVGRVGTREEVSSAVRYYDSLFERPQSGEVLLELVPVRDALGPVASSGGLRTAIEQRSIELISEGGFESEVQGQDLDEIGANALQDIDWADIARRRFAQLDGDEARLALLLEIYLERSDYGGEAFLIPWAVREIRKCAQHGGGRQVIDACQAGVDSLRNARDAEPDASFWSVRLLRAIEFFGGDLAEADREFLEQHAEEQKDPLSIELMLPERDFGWFIGEG
jgi:hypothetical protein